MNKPWKGSLWAENHRWTQIFEVRSQKSKVRNLKLGT